MQSSVCYLVNENYDGYCFNKMLRIAFTYLLGAAHVA